MAPKCFDHWTTWTGQTERERRGKTKDNRCKCVLVGEVLNVLLSLVTWPPRTDVTDDVTAAEDDGTDVGSGSQLSVPSNSMASAAEPRLSTSSCIIQHHSTRYHVKR